MTRIYTRAGDESPQLDKASVFNFFEKRAEKVQQLGPTRAVIYQDKSPDLAERRDAAEKSLLMPLLQLAPSSAVLDAGCGTGRWAEVLLPRCARYFGVDASPGLIRVASERFVQHAHARFVVCPLDNLTLDAIGAEASFSHILSFGVFIYMNDEELAVTLRRYSQVAAGSCRVVIREPIALQDRLTLKEHFSDELEQQYNAIYRTERELQSFLCEALGATGFQQTECGDVYAESSLNNRSDTKQRWYLWER